MWAKMSLKLMVTSGNKLKFVLVNFAVSITFDSADKVGWNDIDSRGLVYNCVSC